MKNEILFAGSILALYELSKLGFSQIIKREAWKNAGKRCEICGTYIPAPEGIHHRVPEKALKRQGIVGTNNLANAAVLCNHGADHHELCDQKAINQRLFWNGSEFVSIDKMPPDSYRKYFSYNEPRRRHKKRHRR